MLTAKHFAARLAPAMWLIKTDFDKKLINISKKKKKKTLNKTCTCWKLILKITNIWFKLFFGKSNFGNDGTEKFSVFQPT